jgi:SAM-dependent methyltransferase
MEIELHHYPCSLCGSTRRQVLFPAKLPPGGPFDPILFRQSSTNIYTLRIVRCIDCGLIYNDPRESETDLARLYMSVEDDDYLAEKEAKLANFQHNLDSIEKFIQSGVILDVGCGHGHFLSLADSKRWQRIGVEPAADTAESARRTYNLTVYDTVIDNAPIAPNSVNACALIHVIEHVWDPLKLLKRAYSLMAPGGIIYIETPNIGGKLAHWTGKNWWFIMRFHAHYFTLATLRGICQKAGFEVMESFFPTRVWSVGNLVTRLGAYVPFSTPLLRWMAKKLNLYKILLTLTFGDHIAVVASKPR